MVGSKIFLGEMIRTVCLMFLALLLSAATAAATDVSLRWDPNDPSPEGYRVFTRKNGEVYDYSRWDWQGTSSACTIGNLEAQTEYHFVVRAFRGGLESDDSIEVRYTTPPGSSPALEMDADDDGMPDHWEIAFGLDTAMDDSDHDLDADGISNHDEFRAGLEPDCPGVGSAPARPEPTPADPETKIECNPNLSAADFADEEGDAHISTQWQIFDTATGECVLDVTSDRRLTTLKVPILLLDDDTGYNWHLRFFDSGGRASEWSTRSHFTTLETSNDHDGYGISLVQEGVGPALDEIHVEAEPDTATPVGISTDPEDGMSTIEQATVVDPADFDIDETTPTRLPSGMVAYKLLIDEPGGWARVTVHLSEPAPVGSSWVKYDAVNGWQDYTDHVEFSSDRMAVTVSVKDGGAGDADGIANGIIVDPSGLAPPVDDSPIDTPSGGGGGGGGCFIRTAFHFDPSTGSSDGIWQGIKSRAKRLLALWVD